MSISHFFKSIFEMRNIHTKLTLFLVTLFFWNWKKLKRKREDRRDPCTKSSSLYCAALMMSSIRVCLALITKGTFWIFSVGLAFSTFAITFNVDYIMWTLLGLLAFCILITFVTFDQVVSRCVMSTKVSMTLFWNKVFFSY